MRAEWKSKGLALLTLCAAVCLPVAVAATGQPAAAETETHQGTWEGFMVGHEHSGKVTLQITDKSIRYRGVREDDWYDATFSLVEETSPRQLRATITATKLAAYVGAVVNAILKIEDGELNLAGLRDDDPESGVFEGNTWFHYQFRKVPPPTLPAPSTPGESGGEKSGGTLAGVS